MFGNFALNILLGKQLAQIKRGEPYQGCVAINNSYAIGQLNREIKVVREPNSCLSTRQGNTEPRL